MTRERFEQILFAHVSDEVVQDMLNEYVLELESSNDKLRELVHDFYMCLDAILGLAGYKGFVILPYQELFDSLPVRMRELGLEVDDG